MIKVKICGLTRIEDILAVNSCQPDYIGFVFVPDSRRYITVRKAVALKKSLNAAIQCVGVFVNQTVEWVAELCNTGLIDMAQLHGDENEDYIATLRAMTNKPIIKSLAVSSSALPLTSSADYLLFDTPSANRGGSGKTFAWNTLSNFEAKPYFLAGGLHNGNINAALTQLSPYCVDVSSGVETDGIKDAQKIKNFVRAVRDFSSRRKN